MRRRARSRARRIHARRSPTGWRSKSSAAFRSRPPSCSSSMRATASIFWIPRDTRTSRRTRTARSWPRTRRSWSSTARRAWSPRRENSSRSARCATSRFLRSSTKWTASRATRLICSMSLKTSSALRPTPATGRSVRARNFRVCTTAEPGSCCSSQAYRARTGRTSWKSTSTMPRFPSSSARSGTRN